MRRLLSVAIATVALSGLLYSTTALTATAACEGDSVRYEDNVPHAGGPGYTTIAVRITSKDCGEYRYLEAINVAYYDPKVILLYSVSLYADSYDDGSWYLKGAWDQVWEGYYYSPNVGSNLCFDPCRVKINGIVDEIGDPDSFFSVSGLAEGDH